jgi:RNA polymerase sigma-70 factor (family 1)
VEKLYLKNLILKIAHEDDQSSFRKLFEYFYPRLFEYSKFFVKSDFFAEEVVSDSFVKVWRNKERLAHVENIQAYLYTIVKRESLNYIRNFKLNEKILISCDNKSQINISLLTPETEYINNELLLVLDKAIRELPDKCRLVFQMVKEDGLKYKEVAEALEISEKSVEKHISNALHKIRLEINLYLNDIKHQKVLYS